jgi:RHS repeat-associated protein
VGIDLTPPTVTLKLPPLASLAFNVTWAGTDLNDGGEPGAGVAAYNVQYQVGHSPTWTPWLSNTTQTQAQFLGTKEMSYTFRVQATDNVGHVSAWVVSEPATVHAVTKYYHHGDSRVAMRRGDEVYYLHGDHLGSTSLTTDRDKNVVAQTRYLPYGEERWTGDSSQPTDFTFTGQRAEAGFGLMDYNARYYSPVLGRFVSPDSIVPEPGGSQGWNRYAYVNNNPVRFTDPTGHQCAEGDQACWESQWYRARGYERKDGEWWEYTGSFSIDKHNEDFYTNGVQDAHKIKNELGYVASSA